MTDCLNIFSDSINLENRDIRESRPHKSYFTINYERQLDNRRILVLLDVTVKVTCNEPQQISNKM